jgi:hydrogenase expression/formation protein HypC
MVTEEKCPEAYLERRGLMCLAVPLKIISIKGKMGIGELGGVKRKINLMLLDKVRVGDYVLLHAGFAINKFKTKEAEELLQLLREISEVSD